MVATTGATHAGFSRTGRRHGGIRGGKKKRTTLPRRILTRQGLQREARKIIAAHRNHPAWDMANPLALLAMWATWPLLSDGDILTPLAAYDACENNDQH